MPRPSGDLCCHPEAPPFKSVVTDNACAECPLFVHGAFDVMEALKTAPTAKPEPQTGAGSELKAMFAHYGIRPCNRCLALARKMNINGTKWCRLNLDALVTEIQDEATRRGWLTGLLAKLTVRRAVIESIERAERNETMRRG